jgi:hypothetical protein
MTTFSHTVSHYREEREGAFGAAQQILLFFAAPFIGLAYLFAYAPALAIAGICLGLKAFGVKCGIFKG